MAHASKRLAKLAHLDKPEARDGRLHGRPAMNRRCPLTLVSGTITQQRRVLGRTKPAIAKARTYVTDAIVIEQCVNAEAQAEHTTANASIQTLNRNSTTSPSAIT